MAQSHQDITAFVYPSKIGKTSAACSVAGDYNTDTRPATKVAYRPVVMKINPRSRVNLHAKNEPRGPAGPNDPDPSILTQSPIRMSKTPLGGSSSNFGQNFFQKRGECNHVTNRTFIVDQIQKENSNKMGKRVFKTTHRQGGEYLKRSCEIT